MLLIIRAQWAGRARFSDAHFRWARSFFLYSQADYSVARPMLAADPRFGRLHAPFNLQTIANEACHTVLLLLGLSVTVPVDQNLEPPLQLAPWLEGRARLTTTVTEQASRTPGSSGLVAGIGIEASVHIAPPL